METINKEGRIRESDYIPESAALRILEMAKVLKAAPRTFKELSEMFDISERTAYRYMFFLENLGFVIETDSNRKRSIANQCPFCKCK
jgi:predicted DNA-binding transcriptional regulator YafY